VVNGGYDVEFEFFRGRRLENPGIDFYFLHAGSVECTQGADDAGFFTGAGGTVDEEMGKVAGLCLCMLVYISEIGLEGNVRGSRDGRRVRGGRLVGREIWDGVCLRGAPLCCVRRSW